MTQKPPTTPSGDKMFFFDGTEPNRRREKLLAQWVRASKLEMSAEAALVRAFNRWRKHKATMGRVARALDKMSTN
jgi:hypothetical protein